MEVKIRNKEIIGKLNGFVDEFFSVGAHADPTHDFFSPEDGKTNGEYYITEEYLRNNILPTADEDHEGYPVQHFAHPIEDMAKRDKRYHDFQYYVKRVYPKELGMHSSALFNYYPPGGFVGWHTNWNAHAYQVLFTWSRTGEGYFRYYDIQKDEVVTIPDVPGWQCRWYYFGKKNEPEHHCWHAAYTKCDRLTIAYKIFNGFPGKSDPEMDLKTQNLRDEIIYGIEHDY
jgi:hypothetical protein